MDNPFLDACGATGPLLLNTESPGTPGGETRAFDLPFALAGRDPRSDLRLNHPDVSDRHAYLQMIDGQVLCVDLGSRTGTFQGGKCQRLGYLERDRAVRIGPYRVKLIGGDRDADMAAPDVPCPPLPLELSHRSVRTTRCDLPAGLALVGSAADCQIRLLDPSVSNYHCSLVHTAGGVWVVDLLGQGGVSVNGQEVGYAQLHEGDSLRIGHSVLRLLVRAAATAPGECVLTAAPRVPDPARYDLRSADEGAQAPAASELAQVSREDAQPADALSAELAERVLGPMSSRIGLIQEQMVEEFRQAREMLAESLATLHREHSEFMSREVSEIRQISEELHALRADLERQARTPRDRTPTTLVPARPGAAISAKPASGRFEIVGNGNGQADHAQATAGFARTGHEGGLIRSHNEQAHAKLCARIARLQNKEQTGWLKALAVFARGKRGKPAT